MAHLAAVSLADRAQAIAATLPHGDQRKLEVAILLALEPDVFMFDEPTAGMSIDEVPTILDIIAAIKKRGDKTILLVEHKMDVVRSLSGPHRRAAPGQAGGRRQARRGHQLRHRA